MLQLVIDVPDDLAIELRPVQHRITEIIELGLLGLKAQVAHKHAEAKLADTHRTELIDFLITHLNLQDIITFRPPEWVNERVGELLYKNRAAQLSSAETMELDQYVALNSLMTQLKATARHKLL